jgi:hypothetical protein
LRISVFLLALDVLCAKNMGSLVWESEASELVGQVTVTGLSQAVHCLGS